MVVKTGGNKKIVLVEDDPQARELIKELLTQLGFKPVEFSNGEDALRACKREMPDLVILDVMLPGIDGFEVCRELKDIYGDQLIIVMLTALNDDISKEKGLEAGCDEFLTKPISMVELSARINNLLKMSELSRQLKKRGEVTERITGDHVDVSEKDNDRYNIMVVEDNKHDQELAAAFLMEEGYNIEICNTGREAIGIAKKKSFDLILLDYFLPDINGDIVFKKLKEKNLIDMSPVIMITSNDDSITRFNSLEDGIDDYLIKPVDYLELKAKVRAMLKSADKQKKLIGNYSRAMERAIKDSMTGLYNNTYLKEFLKEEIKCSRESGNPLTLIMMDLDNFKNFNDTYGHLKGDQALQQVAKIIQKNIRSSDLAARYGGEEFAIVLPTTTERVAKQIAERLRQEVEEYPFVENNVLTISIGVAGLIDTFDHIELLIQADQALYEAKRRGKNKVITGSEMNGR